jgi:tetratricopeptide (TPR) repeat protein
MLQQSSHHITTAARGPRSRHARCGACFIALLLCAPSSPAVQAQRKGRPPATNRTAQAKPGAAFDQVARRAAEAREAGRFDEAIKLYQQGVRQKPNWPEGWWSLGTIYYEADRHAEAVEAFKRLLTIDERGGPAWALLGLSLHQLKNYQQALACLERAAVFGVGDNKELRGVANYHLAILYNRFGQAERAYETWLRVLADRDESPLILQGLGLTMLRLSFLPDETPPEKRELVTLVGKAAYLAVRNRREEADALHKEVVADHPNAPGVHYAYGVFLMRDAPDAALAEFRRELQISPGHVPALLQLAFEYIKRGQHSDGLPYAEQAVKLDPKLFVARNALGRILLEVGQVERAVAELEAGVKLEPASPEMHFALARAYDRAGRKADAARARAEFTRLDKLRRAQREGAAGNAASGSSSREAAKPSAND